ncbi:MAG TPA: [NiFe]-hydrogenase assembly chaperone HybE [Accumulibacter sp.]|uniref:[NiFe]-hydrogenase assembly chaperone HybE n=1 Tax=Accumulibacter sp. TaxID=2053492 RepID=UPI002879545A|nr:[NiFe]-hydrogenase assembly chaperone HybE [Accumulibacter sp.]MDS4054117.1 [NiFe]-hydrogenase assembly chaperone HybE [Accumulibacter sp.]HMV05088.1 [NiFe]-hydrogenase assembly chaperone HybE [Accumulibacter sp.]HMW63290.1 [NiFe]-hydrogenase assembly chaperone HybE [Accumulibacter sp.]HMW79806.1 [NiFe]-hydrogenase assembly chaperone HybE [Accumulibacter sp.]HMX69557.1 [NiFe]-hydrogenase assembly chaperone HybE [Accumulibacter sp.]
MSSRFRQPAVRDELPPVAGIIGEDPAPRLTTMYRRIWFETMHEMPFVNAALSVEALGFHRWQPDDSTTTGPAATPPDARSTPAAQTPAGDWIGAVITPWFINLFVLPGGGTLWSDRPRGERCLLEFPIGPLEFIADHDPAAEIPKFQYCPLFAPPSEFSSQTAARAAALAALAAMFAPPPGVRRSAAASLSKKSESSRRAFFRRIAQG